MKGIETFPKSFQICEFFQDLLRKGLKLTETLKVSNLTLTSYTGLVV